MDVVAPDDLDVVELMDESGLVTGTMPRAEVHGSDTPLHRAFSVYLSDDRGCLLLTRRALTKTTWPGVWSNACCGHPRPGESDSEAIVRRVREELGVEITDPEPLLPDFAYRAVDASGVVENEICPVYRARITSGPVHPDPDEICDVSWVSWDALQASVSATPDVFSPWSVRQVRQIMARGTSPTTPATTTPTTRPPELAETLTAVEALLTERIERLGRDWARLGAGSEPVLAMDLPAWLQSLLRAGGKRLRPALAHWGFVACGGTAPSAGHRTVVEAAAALELLHEFALVHDDVMDESDIRRGQPSAHRQAATWHADASGLGDRAAFGRNIAVLLGDLTLVEAQQLSTGWPRDLQLLWHELCVELVLGQRGDLTGAAAGRRDRAHAERISHLKSAAYTVIRPVDLGALAAGGSEPARAALHRYGVHAGAAFALRDDVLGIWGDPQVTGKPAGDDLREAKPTVVMSMAAERLDGTAADALARAGTSQARDADVPLLQDAIVAAGVLDEVERLVDQHVQEAFAALDTPDLAAAGADGLRALARSMAWRDR